MGAGRQRAVDERPRARGRCRRVARREVRPHPLGVDLEVARARSRSHAAAEPTETQQVAQRAHSACQAPAARSCSWTIAASSVATSPGACCAQPSARHGRDRVALVGHRRRAAAAPPSRTSADLGLGEQHDVAGDLADARRRPRRARRPARRSRPRCVCQGSTGSASPSSPASARATGGPSPSAASVPAAPPSWTASAQPRQRGRAPRRAPASQPAALSPNVVGSGLLEQRAAGHRRVAVGAASARRRVGRAAAGPRCIASSARLVTSIAAVSTMSWLVAPWCTGASVARLQRLHQRAGGVADLAPRRRRSRPRRSDRLAQAAAIASASSAVITPARACARARRGLDVEHRRAARPRRRPPRAAPPRAEHGAEQLRRRRRRSHPRPGAWMSKR